MSQLYLGTQGWTYPAWVGAFYPPATPSSTFLEHYAREFATVELDTTFYAVPRVSTIDQAKEQPAEITRLIYTKYPPVTLYEGEMLDAVLVNRIIADTEPSPVVCQIAKDVFDRSGANGWT